MTTDDRLLALGREIADAMLAAALNPDVAVRQVREALREAGWTWHPPKT